MQLALGRHVALGGIVLGARLLAGIGQRQPALGFGRRRGARVQGHEVCLGAAIAVLVENVVHLVEYGSLFGTHEVSLVKPLL
uniref:Putative secreted protein n=1 Tax=Ixodes ricinus TaxID=34613 RepID=A0A6B0U7E8_IXORI